MVKIFFTFILSLPFFAFAQYDAARYPVIPRPYKLLPFSGEFTLSNSTVIVTDKKTTRKEAEFFRSEVRKFFGLDLKFSNNPGKDNFIYLSEDSADIPHEGYDLFINRNQIQVYGGAPGIFYGLQTLFQLIDIKDSVWYDKDSNIVNIPGPKYQPLYKIPSCSIVDQPRFQWRGMHLDVSRHFFTKDEVKDYLRWMAMYKLNVFHWHLTDDQGWRIEIKKYPKLTQVGAWRNGTLIGHEGANNPPVFDTIHYGGFYTQNDIREIVKFADSLHITIVPEIEMPGHASAMIAAYPFLSCNDTTISVQKTWGVFDDVLCPKEETFAFINDVLNEVCALFPGKYIHIGGDECPKAKWKSDPYCQDLMKKNNLKDEDELQSWFTQRIVKMLQAKGKQAIGWDEILDGGLADGAAVMSWRGEDGGIAAAKTKHFVVMSPGGWCYFDHYQSQSPNEPLAIGGYLPIDKVYSYDPVPSSLSADEQKFILGAQANVWTEYIGDWKKVQYMVFPRICALAEVCWSQKQENDFSFFENRLLTHLTLLDKMDINYAISIFDIESKITPYSNDAICLILNTKMPGAEIHTFIGDTFNGHYNHVYDFPVFINKPLTFHAALFRDGKQVGNDLSYTFNYNLATGKPITLRKQPDKAYNTGGAFTLVDGIAGSLPWRGNQWLGFYGDTLDATIDLGKDTIISEIHFRCLDDQKNWIYAPIHSCIQIQLSFDGKHYVTTQVDDDIVVAISDLKFGTTIHDYGFTSDKMRYVPPYPSGRYRYIRITASTQPTIIPSWNPGAGKPAWLFVSEIEVK